MTTADGATVRDEGELAGWQRAQRRDADVKAREAARGAHALSCKVAQVQAEWKREHGEALSVHEAIRKVVGRHDGAAAAGDR